MVTPKKRRIAAARAAAENQIHQEDIMKTQPPNTAADVDVAVAVNNNITNSSSSIVTTKLLEQHCETIKTLRVTISELVNTNSDEDDTTNNDNQASSAATLLLSSSLALSNLKSLQRQISLQVEAHALTSKTSREKVEGCSLVLENLNYERNYLREEIGSMRGWKAKELERMAWCELGMDPDGLGMDPPARKKLKGGEDVDMEDAETPTKQITTAEEAINAYLLKDHTTSTTTANNSTVSHRDPSAHPHILQKLQSDLQTRSSLVEQLSNSKLELKELQKKRDDLRGFLNQIPKKLVELERVGEGLNSFFGGADVWKDVLNDGSVGEEGMDGDDNNNTKETNKKRKVQAANLLVHRPSCNRTQRFQLAQSNLPSPLYVLFVQLVGYVDAWASLEKLGGAVATTNSAGGEEKKKLHALDGFVGASGMNVAAIPPEEGGDGDNNNHWSVVLTLSPSDILPSETSSILGKTSYSSRSSSTSSSPAAATIKIEFIYSEEQGVVLATVKDEQNKGLDDGLLDHLFPGDDGSDDPNVSLSLLKEDEDDGNNDGDSDEEGEDHDVTVMADDNAKNGNDGKPYYWCQVLSGLNFPPPPSSSSTEVNEPTKSNDDNDNKQDAPPFQIQTCTKAVFRQLHRRIRARRTLTAILEFLGKRTTQMHPLPIHPAMRAGGKDPTAATAPPPSSSSLTKAKLHSWTEDTPKEGNASTNKRCYTATIKRKSTTLKATVTIDTQNYPLGQPPVWSLQNEDGSSGGVSSWGQDHGSVSALQHPTTSNGAPPLFDADLHRIECHVNRDLEKFVRRDVEGTYDWVLIHQLADVVACWEDVMSAGEASGGSGVSGISNSNSSGMGIMGGHRLRKGRDRRLMGFGVRSPFFWYRNGS